MRVRTKLFWHNNKITHIQVAEAADGPMALRSSSQTSSLRVFHISVQMSIMQFDAGPPARGANGRASRAHAGDAV